MDVAAVHIDDPRWREFVGHAPAGRSVPPARLGFPDRRLLPLPRVRAHRAGRRRRAARRPAGDRGALAARRPALGVPAVHRRVRAADQGRRRAGRRVRGRRRARARRRRCAGSRSAPRSRPAAAVTRSRPGYIHTLALPSDPAHLHPNKGHRNYRNQAVRNGVVVAQGRSGAGARDVLPAAHAHQAPPRRAGAAAPVLRPAAGAADRAGARLRRDGDGRRRRADRGRSTWSHNGVLVAKYQGSDPDLPDKRAGYLIDWEMMVAGSTGGYHTLDLGRSDPDADGLRLYKSSWGADGSAAGLHAHRAQAARRPPRLRRRRTWRRASSAAHRSGSAGRSARSSTAGPPDGSPVPARRRPRGDLSGQRPPDVGAAAELVEELLVQRQPPAAAEVVGVRVDERHALVRRR